MPSTLTKQRQVTIVPPLKGQSEAYARTAQPPLTSPDISNCYLYERNGRLSIGTRPGTSKVNSASQIGSGNPVQALHQTTYINGGNKVNVVVAVSNGTVSTSTDGGVTFAAVAGGPHLSTTNRISICSGRGMVYFVDNSTFKRLNLSAGTIATMTSLTTAGTSPTTGSWCCMWRDRVVVGGPDHNWYMSCSGVHTNWAYGRPRPDSAVAGNSATTVTTGGIGDPTIAGIPVNDHLLVVAGDRSIWAFRGDPAAGGQIEQIDSAKGIFDLTGWCVGPQGEIYFVGHGGLFVSDGVGIRPLSQQQIPAFFAAINRSTQRVSLVYDRDKLAVRVYVTLVSTGASEHVLYDLRNEAFLPEVLPNGHGPLAVLAYDGDAPADRAIFLGGRDGYLRKYSDSATTDDGTAITSTVWFGPYLPDGPGGRTKTLRLRPVFGDLPAGFTEPDNWEVTLSVHVGADPGAAIEAAASASAVYEADRRGATAAVRACGNSIFIKATNATSGHFFSIDHMLLDVVGGGEV